MTLWRRLAFALNHRTFGRVAVAPDDPGMIVVFRSGQIHRLRRRCPHQGALLEKGYFEGESLVCPWHGCRFPLRTRPSDPSSR